MTAYNDQLSDRTRKAFEDEYLRFLVDRSALSRFVPTPDSFPLMCQLMHEAKRQYLAMPRVKRNTYRFIRFSFFGRTWKMRPHFGAMARTRSVYIDLCAEDRRSALVTLCLGFTNDLLEAANA